MQGTLWGAPHVTTGAVLVTTGGDCCTKVIRLVMMRGLARRGMKRDVSALAESTESGAWIEVDGLGLPQPGTPRSNNPVAIQNR